MFKKLIDRLKKKKILSLYFFYNSISEFLKFDIIELIKNLIWFQKDYRNFRLKAARNQDVLKIISLLPCLNDRLTYTPMDPIYFLQDCWVAKKIFAVKPAVHYDVGSSAKTMGILSQFVAVIMIDIRPLKIKLHNLDFRKGTILSLPLEDNSVFSISSLCVVEHIGLGRYGDPIDEFGSEKAVKELQRVTAPGGIIPFSVPVYSENGVYFNAHRAFTREYILSLFSLCILEEKQYIYKDKLENMYDKEKGFGTVYTFSGKSNISFFVKNNDNKREYFFIKHSRSYSIKIDNFHYSNYEALNSAVAND